jgi:hypothetical protein
VTSESATLEPNLIAPMKIGKRSIVVHNIAWRPLNEISWGAPKFIYFDLYSFQTMTPVTGWARFIRKSQLKPNSLWLTVLYSFTWWTLHQAMVNEVIY